MSTASQTSRLARRPSFVEVLESRRLLSAAPVASLGTLASVFADAEPDAGQQASIVARVVGGGTASFDFIPGLTSQFSVAATLYDDGTAHGHWICMIPAIVTISGRTLEGTLNADGSVSFAGTGNGIDHLLGGPFFDLPFTVRLWEGGPGVGRFLYDDPVVPDPGDFETVERGGIRIDAQQTAGAGQAMGFGATPIRASDPPDRIFDQVDSLKTDPAALNF